MTLCILMWRTTLLPQPVAEHAGKATTVNLEARGESANGQQAVAEVALRRRDRGNWGKTLCQVVTAPHQFATTTTPGSFAISNLEAYQQAWAISGQSIHNWSLPVAQRHILVPHADHFATLAVVPDWSYKRPSVTIGDHAFYVVN
jgi:spore germination cell wall hydrolase CwlJ-like protein